MDLVFAAEQYAQAQAAVAAAAQYYTNAAISAANGPMAPTAPIIVTSAAGQLGLIQAQAVAAAAAGHHTAPSIISGTQVLGPQFLNTALATAAPLPQAPPPPPISIQTPGNNAINQRIGLVSIGSESEERMTHDSDNRDRRRDNRVRVDRDHRSERERGSDRDSYRSDRYSKYDRDRDRDRDRRGDRDRNHDKRDRDDRRRRDRSPGRRNRSRSPYRRDRDRDCTPESDDTDKDIPPNNTIMVRGLAQHISETDIEDSIHGCGLQAKDIRLIRKKETGASRGFAFVEFAKVQDAQKWMEEKQGVLMFKDQYRAVMQYSLPRDSGKPGDTGSPRSIHHDWICAKCGVQNFRRRDQCFKCNGPKTDMEGEGYDEVSSHPTNTVFLRGLDALSTEDSVLNCLMLLTQLPIKSIKIGRDRLTQTSRGVCYVEMNSVVDAMFLHNQLLGEPPTIDEKLVNVSYHKSSQQAEERNNTAHSAAANAAMAAAQWSHQGQKPTGESQLSLQGPYSEEDIERLAEYSASTYAKNETEKETYLEYYRNYYRNGGTMDGTTSSSTPDMPTEGGQARHPSEASKGASLGTVLVDGIEYKRYGTPDVSTYVYDETSGYYYDATTTLYYDATSQYYFNSKTNQYMYWSNEHETYLPAPDGKEGADQDTDKKGDKKDKVKTAKRIAKDMEKWAKTLNQRKEAAKTNQVTATPPSTPVGVTKINISSAKNVLYDPNNVGAEDIAFSMLNKMDSNGASVNQSTLHSAREPCLDHNGEPPPPGSRSLVDKPGLTGLASYNSDSDEESKGTGGGEEKLTDWTKLACLLCQRQFPSKEKLTKHNQLSDLHKQNLDQWRSRQGSSNGDSETDGLQYRDRAKERRAKFGEADQPKPNKLKEKYMRAMQDVETKALPEKNIGSDNIGSKMLQRMGWKEGLGLGKSNQGRTDIIEAEQRTQKAGLGSSGPVRSNPNDSYKDCVKKTMYQRYHQLDG